MVGAPGRITLLAEEPGYIVLNGGDMSAPTSAKRSVRS